MYVSGEGYTINNPWAKPGLIERFQAATLFSCLAIAAAFVPIYSARAVIGMKGLLPDWIESLIPEPLVVLAAIVVFIAAAMGAGFVFTPSDVVPEDRILSLGLAPYFLALAFYVVSLGVLKSLAPADAGELSKVFLLSGLKAIGIGLVFLIVLKIIWFFEEVLFEPGPAFPPEQG